MSAPPRAGGSPSVADYAELHCASSFSFLRGASQPEELVARAARLGYRALAITDECSVAGVVRAHMALKDLVKEGTDHGLRLIVGSEVTLACGTRLVLLARDRLGYAALSRLITRGRRAAEKGAYLLTRADLDDLPEARVVTLWVPSAAGPAGMPPREDPAVTSPRVLPQGGTSVIEAQGASSGRWVRERFGAHAALAIELHAAGDDRARCAALMALGARLGLRCVAAGGALMHSRGRRALADTLTAIRLGRPVADCGHALAPSGERHLRPREALAKRYPPELLAESVALAARCRFSLDELRYEYPEELTPPGLTPAAHLRRLTEQGLRRRWPLGPPPEVVAQVEHELALIGELGYEAYFLTVHDLVAFARRQGILCQGRGSAANSAVCYCLGITEVDPGRMSMLFERFISKERNEPPDIDVDFEHERREEVIQYLYAKYGRERTALTATVISYRPRSAVRDVGKALGLDASQVDKLASAFQWWDSSPVKNTIDEERIREAGLDPTSPVMARLMALVTQLLGFPRHLSQHVGGFVIAKGPLCELVPIENAAMDERTVIQWDKDDLDALGLLKVDVLALGMLTAIRRTLDHLTRFRGARMEMSDVPAEDPATYAMIQQGDTVGVFQIESRAQMSMLPRLKPRCFYDLVIEVAIVRPGPIQGDMVHPYLRRRNGEEPVTYPSPAVRKVLERTLGVPIFQEQAMQLAIVAAGFTGGEADQLRRAMAAWRRKGGLEPFRAKLIDGMFARGYPAEFAEALFRQIQGFGEYGFPESHAASFALLVYVSCWLKRHEPAAFTAGLLDSLPMGFYAPAQLVQDAQRHGVEVRAVDVRLSGWHCALERRDDGRAAIRLGLRLVKGLGEDAARRIERVRALKPLEGVEDLAARAALDRGELEALAAAGALAALAGNRHRARWAVAGVEGLRGSEMPLLGTPRFNEALPLLAKPTEGEDLIADYASVGLTLGRHPLALLRERLLRLGARTAAELRGLPDGTPARVAGIVINRQRPGTATGVTFMTLEDETGHANVIVWRDLADKQRTVLIGSRLMLVAGVVQKEGAVVHLIARRLFDQTRLLGRLSTRSRDFH
jgi:error-prone DNA polymerase